MKLLLFVLLAFQLVITNTVIAQDSLSRQFTSLKNRLINGDKSALFEIAPYFDSTDIITEIIDREFYSTSKSQIVKEIVNDYCFFTPTEITINDTTSTKSFTDFLKLNNSKIQFSEIAGAYLTTPLNKRKILFQVREISPALKQEVRAESVSILRLKWVKQLKIDSLFKARDGKCLLLIASQLFKMRTDRFNDEIKVADCITLLQYLTNADVAVEDKASRLTWHVKESYDDRLLLNLLIYYFSQYEKYTWDDIKEAFVNRANIVKAYSVEASLFESLYNPTDSTAQKAFLQLSTSKSTEVAELADEYEGLHKFANYSLPTFTNGFLKQLSLLTQYCNLNNIDYLGNERLQNNISQLKTHLPFAVRRKIENELINTLSLDNITALEYWTLIYEQSDDLIYSGGRILDIFYSKNWAGLLGSKKHLALYLKKSKLFNALGIIGTCNDYLNKFLNSSPGTIALLKNTTFDDEDIRGQVTKVIALNTVAGAKKRELIKEFDYRNVFLSVNTKNGGLAKFVKAKEWVGNKHDTTIADVAKKMQAIINLNVRDEIKEDSMLILLSQINYNQIDTAISNMKGVRFIKRRSKYGFLEADFGFYMVGNFNDPQVRLDFLNFYNSLSEYKLYCHYLDEAGIDYKDSSDKLDYDKIYGLLKYDVVTAFVGGPAKQNNETYALVKLLEISFKSTLGFPVKLCNSANIYACCTDDRAEVWMKYLKDKNLLKQVHDEPVSFNYE